MAFGYTNATRRSELNTAVVIRNVWQRVCAPVTRSCSHAVTAVYVKKRLSLRLIIIENYIAVLTWDCVASKS